jgi:hypothetical protein
MELEQMNWALVLHHINSFHNISSLADLLTGYVSEKQTNDNLPKSNFVMILPPMMGVRSRTLREKLKKKLSKKKLFYRVYFFLKNATFHIFEMFVAITPYSVHARTKWF